MTMQQPTLPQTVAMALPFLATMISSWLSQDRLPRLANALIALVAIAITAICCVVLAGNFTGNLRTSVMATLGYVAILMQGDLRVLYQFLVDAPGPLAAALAPEPPPAAKTPPPQAIMYPSQSQQQPPQGGSVIKPPTGG
jgi:predicted PurR-regulated permease PerM